MNKGIFAHVIATIFYILSVQFIIQGEIIDMGGRFLIVSFLLLTNLIIAGTSDINDWYKQKI